MGQELLGTSKGVNNPAKRLPAHHRPRKRASQTGTRSNRHQDPKSVSGVRRVSYAKQPPGKPATGDHVETTPATTPDEQLQTAYESIRSQLAAEILTRVKASSFRFFEVLVVDLMVKMGYGGSREDAGQAVGMSGDEGIDGIIKEDRLGLDLIYLQAKKWEGTVGRPEVQKFVGALHGKKARKGVFITTGFFSSQAREYAEAIDPKVVLIDGRTLANYMIDFNLGMTVKAMYEVKQVDTDYFEEE